MATGFKPADLAKYDGLGIQYVVVQSRNRLAGAPVFDNRNSVAYRVP